LLLDEDKDIGPAMPGDRMEGRVSCEQQIETQRIERGSSATTEKIPSPPLVLIVEDEKPIAESLKLIVVEAGYSATVAANGRAALALLWTQRPALIITDLMMPVMDGRQLIAALREDAERTGLPCIPVIAMTASEYGWLRTTRADGVLRKPFDLADVEDLLRRFLG
jgi:CheY-like chemotaxis protein